MLDSQTLSARSLSSQASGSQALRRRLPNPSLERAAAVGMLDLSDKLLFGGEDDVLISEYLGGEDPLMSGGDEKVVLKYLSKQIAESTLSKVKSRLPLAAQTQLKMRPGKAVLDARNFKVAQGNTDKASLEADEASDNRGAKSKDVESKDVESKDAESKDTESKSAKSRDGKGRGIAVQQSELTTDAALMHQQIDYLNQKVEHLTQELSNLTANIAIDG